MCTKNMVWIIAQDVVRATHWAWAQVDPLTSPATSAVLALGIWGAPEGVMPWRRRTDIDLYGTSRKRNTVLEQSRRKELLTLGGSL